MAIKVRSGGPAGSGIKFTGDPTKGGAGLGKSYTGGGGGGGGGATPEVGMSLRLTTPDPLNLANQVINETGDAAYFVSQGWYRSGLRYFRKWEQAGSSSALTFQVCNSTGTPIPNTNVTVHVNRQYSQSNASMSRMVGGMSTSFTADDANPHSENNFTLMTDSNGYVSFTLDNNNNAGQVPYVSAWQLNQDPFILGVTPHVFCQLSVGYYDNNDEVIDLVELHYYHT